MEARIQKWGNSLGIRIPMTIIKDLSLKNGSTVEIEELEDKIIINPIKKNDAMDLINQITAENIHSEYDWGQPEGDEVW